MFKSPVILALDNPDLAKCAELIESTSDFVGIYKLGLEFFTSKGLFGVRDINRLFPDISIFLDLKLHDIPNTVAGAARALADERVSILTVHAAGGGKMIEAAVAALPETDIAAVTVLTSIDEAQLQRLGFSLTTEEIVLRWASEAVAAGARAIVASPLEVSLLRANLPTEIKLITPGIRFDAGQDDQARTLTPSEAIRAGSDYLVIGRPITKANSPREAARRIYEELQQAV